MSQGGSDGIRSEHIYLREYHTHSVYPWVQKMGYISSLQYPWAQTSLFVPEILNCTFVLRNYLLIPCEMCLELELLLYAFVNIRQTRIELLSLYKIEEV